MSWGTTIALNVITFKFRSRGILDQSGQLTRVTCALLPQPRPIVEALLITNTILGGSSLSYNNSIR